MAVSVCPRPRIIIIDHRLVRQQVKNVHHIICAQSLIIIRYVEAAMFDTITVRLNKGEELALVSEQPSY